MNTELQAKVLKAIELSNRITSRYQAGHGNCVGSHFYRINDRIEIEQMCNGNDRSDVYVDGIEVGSVDRWSVNSAIREKEKSLKLSLIDSL